MQGGVVQSQVNNPPAQPEQPDPAEHEARKDSQAHGLVGGLQPGAGAPKALPCQVGG